MAQRMSKADRTSIILGAVCGVAVVVLVFLVLLALWPGKAIPAQGQPTVVVLATPTRTPLPIITPTPTPGPIGDLPGSP
jgi:hypothetical protein